MSDLLELGPAPTAREVLRELRKRGIRLELEGDRLRAYAAPGVLNAGILEILREHKPALIDLVAAESAGPPPIGSLQANPGEVSLSPSQERLWLFQQIYPDSVAYNVPLIAKIDGPLDAGRLERAIRAVLDRHEPLRSVVGDTTPEGSIVPLPVPGQLLDRVDLSGVPAEARESALRDRKSRQGRPFQLDREIPFRAELVRFGPDKHVLLTTMHHIAVDGTSVQAFYRELVAAYRGEILPPTRITYRQYAAWQREYWTQARLSDRAEYWRAALDGAPATSTLPADRPRTRDGEYASGIAPLTISGTDAATVTALGRAEGASLFMILLAAFGAAMYRESGQRDLVIGSPLHGREHPETGDLIGMFVNQLPLRLKVAPHLTFRDLLREARRTVLDGMAEHEMPYASVVDAVAGDGPDASGGLFQVMLNVLPAASLEQGLRADDVTFRLPPAEELLALFDAQSKFDLTLYAYDGRDEIRMAVVYNDRIFSRERIDSLADGMRAMLALAMRPDTPLSTILAPSARPAVPPDSPPSSGTVVDRIRAIAAATPDAPAINDGVHALSYARLVTEFDRIAQVVAAASPDRSLPVGVMVPHDFRVATAILGVLASGRPYVPLDPDYPPERLRLMAADSGLAAILSTGELRDRAASLAPDGITVVAAEDPAPNGGPTPVAPAAGDLAYLLYTSGSTGTPKAVRQSHRNLLVQAGRYAKVLGISPGDRVALLASISFDASLMDLFGGLLGGALVRTIDAHTTDLSLLPEIVQREGLTLLHFTPTVFRSLSRSTRGREWPSVRAVTLGGESVRAEDVVFFDDAFPAGARLLNLYGSSEHSFSIGEFADRARRSIEVPIGRPLDGVEAVLLDPEGREDPVAGELAIRGSHSALGYHGQPERSATTFATDPAHPGRTRYRTGDLARRRPDGRLVALGRVDGQVKVRGHRIELNEVESVIRGHPAVLDAGVHAPLDADGEQFLVACWISRPGETVTASGLAEWCARALPRYMVPGGWVPVDSLPRTPSGKVDRRALPVPDHSADSATEHRDFRLPDAEEAILLDIWRSVLRRDEVGLREDFFLAGGNSLSATQVVARIRDVLGVQLPLRRFFDEPTVEACARWIRENRAGATPPPPLVARRPLPDPLPLSWSQERMWLLQQMNPESSAYNMFSGSRLRGPLDVGRLRAAFDRVVERQVSLRTTFPSREGAPAQVVGEPVFEFLFESFEENGDGAFDHARESARELMERVYDLEAGPVFRVCLARLGEDDHLLAVGMHHTVSDMWSLTILGREVAACYAGDEDSLPALDIGYPDYSLWQREWLDDGVLEAQVTHWRTRLSGLRPLDLPVDNPRPPFYRYEGDTLHLDLPAELRRGLESFSAEHHATPFMTALAAFSALLAAWSGQDDIAVGVPIANRTLSATENLVGAFLNTLVHRNRVDGSRSFTELLADVRANALDAFANQDVPFEGLLRDLNPERDPSRPPLVQVLFNVANVPADSIELPGVRSELVPLGKTSAQFELVVNVAMNARASRVQLVYNTSLFERATAERILRHYREMLERIVANPRIRVAELQRISSADRALVLEEWNDTAPPPRDGNGPAPESATIASPAATADGLLDLVREHAVLHPHGIAVDSPTGSFTRAELLEYAGDVAGALRDLGVRPGDRVAIVMRRSREMLGALLGILGAGAAYVPVDPNYPAARVRFMLEDSGVAAVVTHHGLERPYEPAAPVLDLDHWSRPARSTEAPPAFVATRSSDPAYVIYTSGSTGKPKGVEVSHGALVNFLLSMREKPGFTASDTLLAVTTISFDIAGLELYLPLVAGGRVVIASEDEVLDGVRLADRIESDGITVMQATPATWKLMIAAGWQGAPGLRVLCGGEPLPRRLADDLLDRVGELWNMYGPTETTIWSTIERVERDTPILIGRPIANTTIYVLDDQLSPRPIGVPGELWIGGAGVANGYVNRPDLTEERFLADPFRPGERIYRTGDLVRYRHDGRLEHLGRLDNQVKVRGFRIELGEVESALQAHPAVLDAVVTARDDRLIAWIVGDPNGAASPAELREWVAASLPPYMVPALWMTLDALPLTPNGKVDRKALPEPVDAVPAPARHDLRPIDPDEQAVLDIWRDVLRVDTAGVDEDFFMAGGNSLTATQVVARIRDVFEVQLPFRQFFENPTVAASARWIRENRSGSPPPPLTRRALPDRIPLSWAQERMWLLQQMSPESAAYNMNAAVRLRGPLDVDRLRTALDRLVERQSGLRTTFPSLDGRPAQVIRESGYEFTFEVLENPTTPLRPDESGDGGWSRPGADVPAGDPHGAAFERARDRAREVIERVYDLSAGPLFRVYLARVGEDDHLFAIGMHHIVSDLWSVTILGRELAAFYAGEGDSLSPLDVTYPDYTLWQRESLTGELLEAQVGHWRERLAGLRPLELPIDHPRPPFFTNEGETLRLDLPEELRKAIETFSARHRATPFMTTLAVFNALLAAWSGEHDIAIGVPIANRGQSATERLIGTFINTLVHRNRVDTSRPFLDLLAAVRGNALDAFAHQDVPFEVLLRDLHPERDTSRPALVQVLFNVANVRTDALELPGLSQELVPLGKQTAQFELTMNVATNAREAQLHLTWNSSLFERATAERMLRHYREMLARVVANPEITVGELQAVSSDDRALLVDGWNDTGRTLITDLAPSAGESAVERPFGDSEGDLSEQWLPTLPELVRRRAALHPGEVVVDSPTGSFTGAELITFADDVAAALRELGVRPGDRVAIVMRRSREMLGALLGILGAGAAYVPVDPNYPAARVRFMLQDSGAAAIVTHGGLERSWEPVAPVLDLDRWSLSSGSTGTSFADHRATPPHIRPGDAAYVIYTSGSTGRPKGVEVSHGALTNFLLSMREEPGFTASDRLLAVTTISFDIAALELYLPLVAGGRVVIAGEDEVLDGRRLAERIANDGITVMQATPATWKLMLSAGWRGAPGMRVLCGGEPLPRLLADDLLDRVAELWNMYGPTETTIWSTIERVERDTPILIGRPIANTTLYVFDEEQRLRPIGVPGELWIGGAGVANGYVNRPELTAERFLPDPFRPGERIYRTGDLVRYRHDGRLEHLGRLDNQVKVRGFRIELGEVETVLQTHPAVRDAVVAAIDDRLIGYVVFHAGMSATVTELRSWVSDALPAYMVPALYVTLEALPLTPNGKVDRKALPVPTAAEPEPLTPDATLDPTERVIAEVWSTLLGIDTVHPGDNFFEIGGHSLLAMEAVALIEEQTGHRPEPRSLFFMTLSEIAATISATSQTA